MVSQAHLLPKVQIATLLGGLFGWSVRQIVLEFPMIEARVENKKVKVNK